MSKPTAAPIDNLLKYHMRFNSATSSQQTVIASRLNILGSDTNLADITQLRRVLARIQELGVTNEVDKELLLIGL